MGKKEFFRHWFLDHLILTSVIFALIYQAVDIALNYFVSGELRRNGIRFYLSTGGIEDVLRFAFCLYLFVCFGVFVKIILLDLRQTQQAQVEHLNDIKEFANNVVHDVKSPAISISSWIKLLSKKYQHLLDDQGKHFLNNMKMNAEMIVALISDINIFIRDREVPLTVENVEIISELTIILDDLRSIIDMRQIQWLQSERIPRIRADRISVHRIFRNLIENSLKHGGDDLSQITIEYLNNEKFHIFKVSDDGCGIEEGEQDEVFKAFSRLVKSEKIEGSGLGLSIVKNLVEKHGGKISVDSLPEKGTCFTLSISKEL